MDATVVISRPREACWRVFVDPTKLVAWVPGLRAAQVIATRSDGLPLEIRFEYAADLIYSLLYTYDLDAFAVAWEPREAQRGGVRGSARFVEVDGGTELTYTLAHDHGRKAAERALDDPRMLVEAFARRLHEDRD
jgi:hypothetical protein